MRGCSESVGARDAPNSASGQIPDKPDGKKLSDQIIRPDSGHVKPNIHSVYLSINAPSRK